LPPEPGIHATFAREHEYKRHGTVSLLAGIDLVTGKVHALVKDRHRSREFIEFLALLDPAWTYHTFSLKAHSFSSQKPILHSKPTLERNSWHLVPSILYGQIM